MPRSKGPQYDVALSFAGEDRRHAKRLAELLNAVGCRTFYDKHEQANLVGKDLYQHLSQIYSQMAQFCVIFMSKHYVKKLWTRHELRAAQERAFKERREYILPIRLDDTPVPGVLKTVSYVNFRQTGPEEAALIILQKLAALSKVVPLPAVGDVFHDPGKLTSFVQYCDLLKELIKSARRLLITYVAIGGSEDLFFLKPSISWFALQRDLIQRSCLEVERVLFVDAHAFRHDWNYRWKLQRIYASLSAFTRPTLRVTAIDLATGRHPVDLQIIQSKRKPTILIVPETQSTWTMHSHIQWHVFRASKDRTVIKKAHDLFEHYLRLPDHSKYLATPAPRTLSPKAVILPARWCKL
ncbi:MAG TPA: TIR domain-containing protein [Chthoniobacterales bacterium]|nr:TIR domain-containing protein [Chthoniobacterales bacterium]